MRPRHAIITAFVFYVLIMSSAHAADEISADVRKSLLESLEHWVTLFNDHDAESLGITYTKDAEVIQPSGEKLAGRAAIVNDFATTFAKNPNIRVKISDVSWRSLTPEIVIEDGKWEESGGSEGRRNGFYTATLVRVNGKWLSKHEVGFVAVPKEQ